MSEIRTDIKFLVMDVDGVLTDGGMYYLADGSQFKKFNTRDGVAIQQLLKKGFHVGFLSSGLGESQGIVKARADILGIKNVYVGPQPKHEILQQWAATLNIDLSETAFMGDDVNDIGAIKLAGFSACPADASEKIKNTVDIVLTKSGGSGCVREFVERFLTEI